MARIRIRKTQNYRELLYYFRIFGTIRKNAMTNQHAQCIFSLLESGLIVKTSSEVGCKFYN